MQRFPGVSVFRGRVPASAKTAVKIHLQCQDKEGLKKRKASQCLVTDPNFMISGQIQTCMQSGVVALTLPNPETSLVFQQMSFFP